MVEEQINILRKKLDKQIELNDDYETICETSSKIDKLIIDYYKEYGLAGVKQII
jgi:hypothetical protein